MRAFVDTSALYALLDRDDENHEKAKHVWAGLLGDGVLPVTSNYVVVEAVALVQHRLGVDAVRAFQGELLPVVHVEFVDRDTHRSGMSVLLSSGRRGLSLVDCVSFELMRALGTRTAFAFDSDFEDQGFEVLS